MGALGLLFENDAIVWYPGFKRLVLGIMMHDRSSTMKDYPVQKVRKRQAFCDRADKEMYLMTLLPLVVKGIHLGKENKEGEAMEDYNKRLADCSSKSERERFKKAQFGVEEFWDDGLRVTQDKELQRTLLPKLYMDQGYNKAIAGALAKVNGMESPKAGRTYSIGNGRVALSSPQKPESFRKSLHCCNIPSVPSKPKTPEDQIWNLNIKRAAEELC